MRQNIALIGSLPTFSQQQRQVRVHWLLDLIQLKRSSDSEYIDYNFDHLDAFIDLLHENNLKPGFQLMGNPSKFFRSFSANDSEKELIIWWDLIKSIASRYINRYGINYVKSWNFESWNEPDMRDFDGISNMTIKSFINYFTASYQGLMEADHRLQIIGPGERCLPIPCSTHASYCWSLIDKMVKIIANEKDRLKIAFSFHSKSGRLLKSRDYGDEDSVDIRSIIDKEMMIIKELMKRYQHVDNLPIIEVMNNQAEIEMDWSKPKEWKADATYAGLMVKSVAQHIDTYFVPKRNNEKHFNQINFTLLSHDNSFLSYFPHQFTQQTMFSRFQINNTNPNYVTLIKKPIYSATGLLSLLGDRLLDTKTILSDNSFDSDNINLISSVSENGDEKIYSFLYVNSLNKPRVNSDNYSSTVMINTTLKLTFDDLANDWKLVRYTIDNNRTNPYKLWKELGSKPYLTSDIIEKIKSASDPIIDMKPKDLDIKYSHIDGRPISENSFELPLPAVSLVLICSMKNDPPEKLIGFKAVPINENQVLLVWRHSQSRYDYLMLS